MICNARPLYCLENVVHNKHFFCFQLRTSRNTLEECGVVAFQIKKREQNFSKMLTYIFARYLAIKVFMLLMILFSYSFCTFPAVVLHLNDQLEFFKTKAVPDWITIFLFVLAMVPTTTNPLLYVVSDPKYRR